MRGHLSCETHKAGVGQCYKDTPSCVTKSTYFDEPIWDVPLKCRTEGNLLLFAVLDLVIRFLPADHVQGTTSNIFPMESGILSVHLV